MPFQPADPRNFVGSARVKRLPMVEEGGQSVIVYLVEFEPGGRTNWHRHSAPQLLLVKEGRGLVQKWGEPVRAIAAGDADLHRARRKTLAWRRRRDKNGALRRQSDSDHRVARARIGRPISCILS